MAERWYNVINVSRATILRRKKLTWKAIGIKLAQEEGRQMPYGANAVQVAVARFRRNA